MASRPTATVLNTEGKAVGQVGLEFCEIDLYRLFPHGFPQPFSSKLMM